MASIIEGYNYDIFISYRQKDNKGDRWVSKFVEDIKTELEATFKEDVSVYFDENPHDRLQETHDVDKSLEGKLKCLIFIPILSQTFCDPNSFAWQNEFLAFIQMVKNDRFGKDVKLRSGNVASRVLPIRIHDLEPEDVKLFEKETRSVLRAMDFVFKTGTGAIRPLLPNEDHPNDNLYKTFYRDQISKVAIAIKEIVLAMKGVPASVVEEKDQVKAPFQEVKAEEIQEVKEKPTKAVKVKFLIPITIVVLLIVAGIITYPKIFKRDTLERLKASGERISVAVMPFQNMTNDTTWNVWQEGIQESLTSYLSNYSEDLIIRQTELVTGLIQGKGLSNYASITSTVVSSIAKKLEANIAICGSINQVGSEIRLNAQLIDPKTKEIFKAFQIDGKAEKIIPIIDSLSKEVKNLLVISNLEKEVHRDLQPLASTNSPEAYRFFILGENSRKRGDQRTAAEYFSKAIDIDSNFLFAIVQAAFSYANSDNRNQAVKLALKVYEKRDLMSMPLKVYSNCLYAFLFQTPYEQIKWWRQLQELNDQSIRSYYGIGRAYCELYEYDNAIPELEKLLSIYEKLNLKPYWAYDYSYLLRAYYKTGQYKKVRKLLKKAEQDFPDNSLIISRKATLALTDGKIDEVNQCLEKYISIYKRNSFSEAAIASNVANIYSEAGIFDKAEEYYRKALSLEPKSQGIMNTLAYFLINNDRNVNEGLELIDTILKSSPDNHNYLHTKGWALYRQGKYQEALEILQKSWDLRMKNWPYNHEAFLHLEAVKKAVAKQK